VGAEVPVPTSDSNEKVTPTTEMEDTPVFSSYLSPLIFTLVLIALAAALFVWLGGIQFVRRILPGSSRAQYRKVDEEDLEKRSA